MINSMITLFSQNPFTYLNPKGCLNDFQDLLLGKWSKD